MNLNVTDIRSALRVALYGAGLGALAALIVFAPEREPAPPWSPPTERPACNLECKVVAYAIVGLATAIAFAREADRRRQ